jgi:hypothetical protein
MLACPGTAVVPRRRLAVAVHAGQARATINAARLSLLPGRSAAAVMIGHIRAGVPLAGRLRG